MSNLLNVLGNAEYVDLCLNAHSFCSCHDISSCLCPAHVCNVEQKDPAEPFDVEEVVQEMPRDQRETLWGRLVSLLHDILLELPAERWQDDMEVDSAADPVS